MTELEPLLVLMLRHRVLADDEERDEAQAEAASEGLQGPLQVLEDALDSGFLLGPMFTTADLNVAAVLSWARFVRLDLAHLEKVSSWLARCLSRPAAARALALD